MTGCPCKIVGYVGQDIGKQLLVETNLVFEWCFVTKTAGEPYTVHIPCRGLVFRGRDVPHSPLRLRGCPGLMYSLHWFENFAENVMPGLQFCGLVYEGHAVEMHKALPAGGVDVLATPV